MLNYSNFAIHLLDSFSHPVVGEQFRKEIYLALQARLESHTKLRKKITEAGVPAEQPTEIDRMIALYRGPDGLLTVFMNDEEEEAEETKKNGTNPRQVDLEEQIALEERERKAREESAADQNLPDLEQINTLVKNIESFGPPDIGSKERIAKAINGLTRDECYACNGYYIALTTEGFGDGKIAPKVPYVLNSILCELSAEYKNAAINRDKEEINATMRLTSLAKESGDRDFMLKAADRLADVKPITNAEVDEWANMVHRDPNAPKDVTPVTT